LLRVSDHSLVSGLIASTVTGLHWRGRYPLEDTIAAFEQLEREGKILAWGVSNFDLSDLEEAVEIAGEDRLVCNQVLYHLKERTIEHAVIPWCEKTRRCSRRIQSVRPRALPERANGRQPRTRRNSSRARRDSASGRAAVPGAPTVTVTIPKSSNPEHASENAGAGDLHLTDAELARIDKAFPLGPVPRELPTL